MKDTYIQQFEAFRIQREIYELGLKNAQENHPRMVRVFKLLLAGKDKEAEKARLRVLQLDAKDNAKAFRKKQRENRKYHKSHKMTSWYGSYWSPHGGEPRLYSHRHCTKCEFAQHEHQAGYFYDTELKNPCYG